MSRPDTDDIREPLVRRRTLALVAGYWSFGQFWGFWVILVYEFQARHLVSDSRLGSLYAVGSVAAIVTMTVGAPRLQRLPLSVSVPIALGLLGLSAFGLALQPTSLLVLTFCVTGIANGLIDVYLNVGAQREEARTRRPVLQWLHASYALGGVTGAGAAGALRAADFDYRVGVVASGAALLATAWWNRRQASSEPATEGAIPVFSISALRRRALWIPALTVLFAFLVEGSMDIWSGLYLREEIGATAVAAAGAFIAFAGALFVGRLFAARVLFGLGPRRTILIAGVGATIGGTIAVLSSTTVIVGAAFLVMGFGISAAGPAGFSLVEESGADPSSAIAAVAAVGYTGFVWSPPLLGWIADTVDLRAAMAVIVLATFGITGTGVAAMRRARR